MRAIPISVHANRPLRAVTAALALSIVAAPHGARGASIVFNTRATIQTLSFSDTSAFSDASLQNHSEILISGNAGDSYTFNWQIPDGATGFSATATSTAGAFSVSSPVFTSGTPNDTEEFTLIALDPSSSGTLTIVGSLGVNVAPSGGDTTLSTEVSGSYNFLDVTFNPVAKEGDGNAFDFTAKIPGDYSGTGIGTGGHRLISLNSNWTISQPWVYNGKYTIFTATINDYQHATDQIGLEYQIYGAPVSASTDGPIPLWALGALGAGLVGIASRRLKKAA